MHRGLVIVALVACSPKPTASATEVPVAAVSGATGSTAAPPPAPNPLPSSRRKTRPMTPGECRTHLARVIDSEMAKAGMDPMMVSEQRAQLMQTMEPELERCYAVSVTDAEVACILHAPDPMDVEHCHALP